MYGKKLQLRNFYRKFYICKHYKDKHSPPHTHPPFNYINKKTKFSGGFCGCNSSDCSNLSGHEYSHNMNLSCIIQCIVKTIIFFSRFPIFLLFYIRNQSSGGQDWWNFYVHLKILFNRTALLTDRILKLYRDYFYWNYFLTSTFSCQGMDQVKRSGSQPVLSNKGRVSWS